jgi:hypothetical protein
MEVQVEETTSPTGGLKDAASEKRKPSAKDKAKEIVMKGIPNKDGKPFPVERDTLLGEMRWRKFDQYVLDKGWDVHAARLRGIRDKPIITPFGNHFTFEDMLKKAEYFKDKVKSVHLKGWEEREYKAMKEQPTRGKFDPMMYLARLQLYDSSFYPKPRVSPKVIAIPKFQPLAGYAEVEIRPDAKRANVGFPILKHLSESGQTLKESPVYLQVCIKAAEWKQKILHLNKITRETVVSMSPPIAVFDRAQSQGRAVQAISKIIAFNQALIVQPLIRAAEDGVPQYLSGDRARRLSQMLDLINGKIKELADGDDLAVLMDDGNVFGVDASAFESGISSDELKAWRKRVMDMLPPLYAKIYEATKYAETVEMACSVGMVINAVDPTRGVKSGTMDTHVAETFIEAERAQACSRKDIPSFLKDIGTFGIYREEHRGGRYVILGKLYVSIDKPEAIHGSVVRATNALFQREDPVLGKSRKQMKLEEDARIVQICSNLYGHELFEEFVKWVKSIWRLEHAHEAIRSRAEDLLNQSKQRPGTRVVSGEYERKAIEATLAIFG